MLYKISLLLNHRPSRSLNIADVWIHGFTTFSPLSDKCRVSDQKLVYFINIHNDNSQCHLHMDLIVREESWIKFCI